MLCRAVVRLSSTARLVPAKSDAAVPAWPATVQTTLLARLASTVALYYLQGAERMTDDVRKAYDGVIDTLKAHSRGDLDLVPAAPTDPAPSDDLAVIESQPRRYRSSGVDEVGL